MALPRCRDGFVLIHGQGVSMPVSVTRSGRFIALLVAASGCLLGMIPAQPAHAQFVCGGSATGAPPLTGGGATATGLVSTACGALSMATNEGTAFGWFATAAPAIPSAGGANSGAVAIGNSTNAFGDGATAVGAASNASASYAIAIGASSDATGVGAIAIGGSGSVGLGSNATAPNSIAIGSDTTAGLSNSVAIGSNVVTTRANQVALGTASNTYTLAGVSSAASLAAQAGPVKVVTADAQGNLATASFSPQDITALQSNVGTLQQEVSTLQQQMKQAFEGTAIAIALGGTSLPADKKFAISTNWGNFRGQNAVGVAAQYRLSNYAVANIGIGGGFAQGGIGSRAGVTFAW
jgi:hypothetical protein